VEEPPVWDNPRVLNWTAGILCAGAVATALAGGGVVFMRSSAFPLNTIRVVGDVQHVGLAQVIAALQGRVRGTFFSVDIDAIRGLFEGLPWVRRAEVRRLWPDGLEVRLEEHVALARWGQERDARLVNTYGEPFRGRVESKLPLFVGPPASEGMVTRRYADFRSALAPLGLEPRAVSLSARYAWQLELSNGTTVKLGRDREKDDVVGRLARFVAVYPYTVGKPGRRLEYVDLRYPNGFAVRASDDRAPHESRLPRT
jgi:cell division protein FtsQ